MKNTNHLIPVDMDNGVFVSINMDSSTRNNKDSSEYAVNNALVRIFGYHNDCIELYMFTDNESDFTENICVNSDTKMKGVDSIDKLISALKECRDMFIDECKSVGITEFE